MISRIVPKIVSVGFAVAAVGAFYIFVPFATARPAAGTFVAQDAAAPPELDYEFFKARVEPIFLKHRSPAHARCYSCHEQSRHPKGLSLATLSPGSEVWNEQQSRKNFEVVSDLVVPGNPTSPASMFPMHPLAQDAGGNAVGMHFGGRQFESQSDPDFQAICDWIRGKKLSNSSGK
jgi:hypothetical protein